MGNTLDGNFLDERENGFDVNSGGGEEGFADGLAAERFVCHVKRGIVVINIEYLAAQGEAVGMDARGGERKDHVAGSHFGVVDDLLFIDDTDGKACEVVVLGGHKTGVLGGLTADQRRAGLHAALGNAGNDSGDLLGNVFAARDIVQEEKGSCAAANNVVDTHGDGINADGVVLVHEDRELDLRAATVRAGNENGLLHTHGKSEAAAEAADVVDASLVAGARDMCLHEFNSLVAGGDINTGRCVAFGFGILHGWNPPSI